MQAQHLECGLDRAISHLFTGARKTEPARGGKWLPPTGIGEADVELSVILAMDEQDRLLVEAQQTGGADDVVEITGLYRFAITPHPNSYLVVAH